MVDPSHSPDPYLGKLINERFLVERLIARGAMGRVYLAEQAPLGRAVAVKVLDPQRRGEAEKHFERRFFLEASVVSNLRHPNTVTVFDYGRTEEGHYFIAMEFVDGESLLSVLYREKRLSPMRAATIAVQVARSLREAHRLDVVHRDLKPANVLLMQHGDDADFVKVLDFGLVKPIDDGSNKREESTQTGVFMGSPRYMAPEQIRGGPCDGRTDIYALGAVMYQLLSGVPPFDSDTAVKILMSHMHDPVPPIQTPGVPESFKALVYKCLAKDPAFRPASMGEVVERLKQLGPIMGRRLQHDQSAPPRVARVPVSSHARSAQPQPTPGAPRPPRTVSGPRLRRGNGALQAAAKVVVVAGATMAAGFLALRAVEGGQDPGLPWVQPHDSPEAQPSAPVAASPVPIVLTSDPTGASISFEGRIVGVTPHEILLPPSQAAPGQDLRFQFDKPGHERAQEHRAATGAPLTIHAHLRPLP